MNKDNRMCDLLFNPNMNLTKLFLYFIKCIDGDIVFQSFDLFCGIKYIVSG